MQTGVATHADKYDFCDDDHCNDNCRRVLLSSLSVLAVLCVCVSCVLIYKDQIVGNSSGEEGGRHRKRRETEREMDAETEMVRDKENDDAKTTC